MHAYRDQHGIPHARAAPPEEAFGAQGRIAATDRGLQMEFVRRRALGTWAEVVGSRALSNDTFVRRVGLAAAARRTHEALGDETKSMLAAYADGVNAVLADRLRQADADLPAPPEPREPRHSVAVYPGRHGGIGSTGAHTV